MATTIVTKNGSGAPAASDLVAGELAVDLTNGRLYTEDSGGSVIEIGLNPSGNVDVTGTVTADGLTVSASAATANITSTSGGATLNLTHPTAADGYSIRQGNANADDFRIFEGSKIKLNITTDGDISFYEDTGTTAKLFWDASAESLGIGTTSLTTSDGSNVELSAATSSRVILASTGTGGRKWTMATGTAGSLDFYDYDASAYRMRIDASGNVGIGTSSPAFGLSVEKDNGSGYVALFRKSSSDPALTIQTTVAGITQIQGLNAGLSAVNDIAMQTSGGNVGIGTSSPFFTAAGRTSLSVNGTSSSILAFGKGGSSENYILADVGGLTIANTSATLPTAFFNNGSTRMTISSAGTVGIGMAPDANNVLSVKNTSGKVISLTNGVDADLYVDLTSGLTLVSPSTGTLAFGTSNTERMRLDASGNLLVGKTTTAIETVGINLFGTGRIISTADGDDVAVLNRKTSDGDIAVFKKDGTTVGSIGSISSDLYIAEGNSGLRFDGENNQILPASTTASTDGTCNLGASSARFKDLYLSGGAYLGGTAAANKLEDYEEGTWTPQVNFGGSDNGVTYGTRTGRYTKIGRMVYLSFNILLSSKGSQTGQVTISGAPFGNYAGSQNNASPIICEGNGSSFPDAFGMMWNDNQIYVRYQGATSKLPVYESNFTNSTQIFGMMQYET